GTPLAGDAVLGGELFDGIHGASRKARQWSECRKSEINFRGPAGVHIPDALQPGGGAWPEGN
ncbi:MAG TPA: hypothetical protein VK465_11620, partial [Fibrobacteria bacterium]|nr:hypothetical protein [Fibrobacteria bacterium]